MSNISLTTSMSFSLRGFSFLQHIACSMCLLWVIFGLLLYSFCKGAAALLVQGVQMNPLTSTTNINIYIYIYIIFFY